MPSPDQIKMASCAIRELRVALSNFFLYSSENAMVQKSLDRFLIMLNSYMETSSSLVLAEAEGRMVVDGIPLDERLTGSTNMIKDLFLTHKIHSLTFSKGLDSSEIRSLFSHLRPKALPSGVSLSQALVQEPLEHIGLNEKVYVALSEGEMVVPSESAPMGGQNLDEAMEALQYFLQIFARVKPESNKQEVARRLITHMGDWIQSEQIPDGGAGEASGLSISKADPQPWQEVLGGFFALRQSLTALKSPHQLNEVQVSMDELLRKLVLLGENQGIQLAGEIPQQTLSQVPDSQTEMAPQKDLFEVNPILDAFEKGSWDVFFDPALEEKVNLQMPLLQAPEKADAFKALWSELWQKISYSDEKFQTEALRHLNRMQWNRVPRPLQLEGLKNLHQLLLEMKRPVNYPIALTLTQDWIPQELANPDWGLLLELVRLIKKHSEKKPPLFDKQDLAAKVALDTIFCEPVLKSLLVKGISLGAEGEGIRKLFQVLGGRVTPFLYGLIENEPVKSPIWMESISFLESLQDEGLHVYEAWLDWPEKRNQMEKFLEIFKTIPPRGEILDYFERHWTSFGTVIQTKILEIVEQWKKTGFRIFLMKLLERPEVPIAYQALQTLSRVGLEGDGKYIVKAVRDYPSASKGRDSFWQKACQSLGVLADTESVQALMEWAGKYKFMESRKDRSLEIRRAAVEALGQLRSQSVLEFLSDLQREGEKELKGDVELALKSVKENLARPAGKKFF